MQVESKSLIRAILDSLPFPVAALNPHGTIISVNKSWMDFGRRNGIQPESLIGPGADYLDVCRRAAAAGCQEAKDVLAGIQAVCDGSKPSYELRSPFHSPDRERWFQMTVTPLPIKGGGAVIAHIDIIDRRATEEALLDLGRQLISAQEEERSRIARDLHDNLSQRMALLSIEIDQLAQAASASLPEVGAGLREVLNGVQEASSEIHRMSYELHPSKLDRLGLAAASSSLCREISRQQGIKVECVLKDIPDSIPRDVALCLYRVLQESLQNVIKHSGASSATVELRGLPSEIRLSVIDEGAGFRPESAGKKGGLGLLSMRERLRLVGGTISVESQPLRGTRINAMVHLPQNPRKDTTAWEI